MIMRKQENLQRVMHKKQSNDTGLSEEDKKEWDSLYEKKLWEANYPFSVSHVEEFAEFAENSGGFQIC